ncbi:type IV pilus assembly protein PilW [Duganella sp. CF458]|uniref:PilW family protein n=1 Tax=Duganella sp. CF458 TaxID=1884368 RepID=UPI0008E71AD9|nr:PilW family protein [Duganella sp. CF458]SFF74401.1 type IV pilus assembly protein PilW [Duganella sp. CF458]
MHDKQNGFGLVEIMVGLGVGMLAMVVVMQVFSQMEGQKRTSTGGADAQSNGAIALSMIERDAKMAGWGMANSMFSGCNTTYSYCDGDLSCGGKEGAIDGFSLASAVITDGGAKPDSILVQYFANPTEGSFRYPANTELRSNMPQPSSELNVGNTSGCREGDLVLVQQAGNCTLMQATQIQEQALKIQHNPGGSGHYNPPANYQNANNWPKYTKPAQLSCFSAPPAGALYQRGYSVNDLRQLLRSDNSANPAVVNEVVAPEIIDMQLEYGVSLPGQPSVSSWQPATGAWAKPTPAQFLQVKALRVALVARSVQYERPAANQECVTTSATAVTKWSSWATFNTTNYPADWKCYRYKVFETIVPLRNVIWG